MSLTRAGGTSISVSQPYDAHVSSVISITLNRAIHASPSLRRLPAYDPILLHMYTQYEQIKARCPMRMETGMVHYRNFTLNVGESYLWQARKVRLR